MKKTTALVFLLAIMVFGTMYVGCGPSAPKGEVLATKISRLPQDVLQSCTLTQSDFNSWFAGGKATENGMVVPANSVTFGHKNNCDFYKWSWQMFSWITSPMAGDQPAGFNTVMESPVFYTVSPADSKGQRHLIPHKAGEPLRVASNIKQLGPNKLPLIQDKQGNLFEVEQQTPNQKPLLLKGAQKIAVHSVEMDAAGKPVFKDQSGKIITNPKAHLPNRRNTKAIVQEFITKQGKSVFLHADGRVIESEEGQAGGGNALLAQNGSLVYYISMVNDVFAFYLTGAKEGKFSNTEFPTKAEQRDSICAFARKNGVTLPDSNALAMEIKTSWVEAASLPDAGNYVTIDAIVPVYNKSDTLWVPVSEKKVKLALLGMHVVGSTAGHPEMVWATFEHQRNTPNASYQYLNSSKAVVTVPQDSSGKWTLNGNPLDPAPNQSHFKTKGADSLVSIGKFTISPSNSTLAFPWGTQANVSPNAEDGSSAASNSEVISINNNVLGFFIGNDIRKNYMLIGATWTNGGAAPNGLSYSADTISPKQIGDAIGTSLLANSTMETYYQFNYTSCFYCHSNNSSLLPGDLSHVYDSLQPLPDFKIIPAK